MSKTDTIAVSMSVQQFADMFQVSAATVRNMIRSQKVVAYRVGRQWRIPKTETAKFIGAENEQG